MSTLQVRVDDKLKAQAESLFASLGLDTSTAVRIFLSAAVENNGIPFAVQHQVPNAATLAALKEVEDMKKNPSKYKSYTDVDSMMEDLLD